MLSTKDGRAPAAIMRDPRLQLCRYSTAKISSGEVVGAHAIDKGFTLRLAAGGERHARRLVLATGVSDELPAVPGMRARWGSTVLHCPYCHGYEVRDQPLGVLAAHPMSPHQALLIPDWGPTTYFTQDQYEPEPADLLAFETRGVTSPLFFTPS